MDGSNFYDLSDKTDLYALDISGNPEHCIQEACGKIKHIKSDSECIVAGICSSKVCLDQLPKFTIISKTSNHCACLGQSRMQ